jgi:hypothetical protein
MSHAQALRKLSSKQKTRDIVFKVFFTKHSQINNEMFLGDSNPIFMHINNPKTALYLQLAIIQLYLYFHT